MKDRDRPRFDVDAVRRLAGETSFGRGETYFRDGLVQILALEPDRVLAEVSGTDEYRTVLAGSGRRIGGECSCPAFADRSACKHMVAVALAANAAEAGGKADGVGALARIRDHLRRKGVDALVEMIVDMAERDPALFRRLDLAASVPGGDGEAIEARFRKAIDGATRTRGFVGYDEAAGWAEGVDAALDALADLASGASAGAALRLAERAIDRIERAIEEIDDSDGHCGTLLDRAGEIHLAAALAARPDPVRLAGDLFARETKDGYGTFAGAATTYADVLGESGLAEYRRLATDAWEQLPSRAGDQGHGARSGGYDQLMAILDVFAERDGDVAARIALRAKDLSSPWHYLRFAEFCREHGREDEALRRAEEGLWVFEDQRPDDRLVLLTVGLLLKAGRKGDAETQLWRTFEKSPSLDLYKQVRKLGGKPARDRALSFLETRLAKARPTLWDSPADLLVEVQMKERMLDAAWATVRMRGASRSVKDALARASEATHPREALAAYAERVEELARAGGDPAYRSAAALVVRMAGLRSTAEQAAYVADLKERHRRKRNFMKLL